MQRSLGVLRRVLNGSSRFFVVVLLALGTALAVACGGGTDKPPLTPDDPTANAMDAGDTPLADPNVTPAAPAAPAAH
ncbi:MAG: hypothetical protein ABI183_21830 [Polyangiaceae bacterium]